MSTREELDRVQLEPEREMDDEDYDAMSESAPSIEGEDAEYEVDAIKYAHYQDKTRTVKDGKKGWYYGIMWKGYLKYASDTEEPYEMFNEPDQGASSILREFWASVVRPLRRQGKDPEPLSKTRNEVVECPDSRMKAWLKETKPHRYFDVYKRRRAKEKAGEPITRADSDYYVRLRRKAEAKKKKRLQLQQAAAASSSSTNAVAGPSTVPGLPTPAPSEHEDEPVAAAPSPTPVPATASVHADAENEIVEGIPGPSANAKGKRKAQIPSSPSPEAADGPSKKARTATRGPSGSQRGPSKSKSPRRVQRRIESPPPTFEPAPGIFDQPTPISASIPADTGMQADEGQKKVAEPLFVEVGDDADADEVEAEATLTETAPVLATDKVKSPVLPAAEPAVEIVSVPVPKSPTPPAATVRKSKTPPTIAVATTSSERIPTPPPTVSMAPTAPAAPAQATTAKSPTFRSAPLPMLSLGSASSSGTSVKSPPSANAAISPSQPPLPTPPASAPPIKAVRPPTKRMSETMIDPEVAAKLAKKGIKPSKQVHVPAGLRGNADPSLTQPPLVPAPAPVRPPPIPEIPIRTGPPLHIGAFAPPPVAPPPVVPPAAPPVAVPPRANFVPRPPPTRMTASNNQPLATQTKWGQRPPPTGPAPPRNAPTGPSGIASLPLRPPGVVSPIIGGTSPNTYGGASPNNLPTTAYNPSADPRRRGAVPPITTGVSPAIGTQALTPVSAPPPEPAGPRPPAPPPATRKSGHKVIEVINSIRLAMPRKADMDVILYRGASHATADVTLGELPNGTASAMNFEVLDGYCLAGQLKHGARVLEWAKVALPYDAKGDLKRDWEDIKVQAKAGKIFACYTENPKVPEIDSHYAIVLVSADRMDFSAIPLEGWAVEDIEVAAIMVALPLDSDAPPLLPNPVRPLVAAAPRHTPRKGWSIRAIRKMPILRSYGLDDKFMEELRNKVVHYRLPTSKTLLDELFRRVEAAFKQYDVQPVKPERPTNLLLLPNDRLYSAIQSGTLRENVPRRTTIMSVGPTLSLLPSQWKVREIWESGGLVTFSPTFILRYPAKFLQIMQIIRSADHWAAYIIPAVIDWADDSWAEPTRCPDAPATYSALTTCLFLDQHNARFAGKAAISTGGLAVSTCPPSVHKTQACAEWSEWLHTISTTREYSALAKLAKGVSGDDWEKGRPAVNGSGWVRPGSPRKGGLELVDVERAQLDDLIAMRQRPDLLPYRRYLYIGQISLDRKAKEIIGNSVEFIAADDFEAVFSGAV